jgi:hypothetical protein
VDDKQELLASLRAVFNSWEKLLAGESEEEITVQRFAAYWSTKDVIAHLRAWQQISIARLEAAILDTEPEFPTWLAGADPFFAEDHTDEFNARIYEIYHDQSCMVSCLSGLERRVPAPNRIGRSDPREGNA